MTGEGRRACGQLSSMNPERRKRIGRVVEARKAGDSLRAIASRERVSEKQIRLDLKCATAEGIAATPPTNGVIGLDGRRRGARKPAPLTHAEHSEKLKGATAEGIAAALQSNEVGLDGTRSGAKKPSPPVQANGSRAKVATSLVSSAQGLTTPPPPVQTDRSQVEVTTLPVPSRPRLCLDCQRLGYPHCRECVLANDPGLEVGRDGVIYRVRLPAEQAIVGWHRCENCNAPYHGPMPRFGTPKLCPKCVSKPAGP